jgi:moderate conductance mechanosensitive channel
MVQVVDWFPLLEAASVAPDEVSRLALLIRGFPLAGRLAAIALLALLCHGLVRAIRYVGEWLVAPPQGAPLSRELLALRKPKFVTLTGLVVSAATFTIYFMALGFVLRETTAITLGQYMATATVVGLAVGFGTQGLVQDVVTGLTLIFSDALDVQDVVEVAGHIGRVEHIGLRFTILTNFVGQTVAVPNRAIAVIGRYRRGYARCFVDVQLAPGLDEGEMIAEVGRIARAFRAQHPAALLGEPRVHAVQETTPDGWRYVRTRFRVWPGQQALVESSYRPRLIAALKERDPAFQDWMLNVTYRSQ